MTRKKGVKATAASKSGSNEQGQSALPRRPGAAIEERIHMKRRVFLGAGLGGLTLAAPAVITQANLSLSLVTDHADAGTALAARIAGMSGGRITVDVEASPPPTAPQFLDRVSAGEVEMYLTSQDAFITRNPAFGLFAAMPGGMNSSELESWIIVGDGRLMWDALGAEFGIKAFLAGDEGAMPVWSRSPLTSLDDLKSGGAGSTGLGLQLLREMGVEDVVDVRERTDFTGVTALEGFNVAQMVATGLLAEFPHMTTPNGGRPSSTISAGVNLQWWSGLSPTDRIILEQSIMAEHGTRRAFSMHTNVQALGAAGGAITAHDMPQDIWDAQIAGSNRVLSAMFDAGPLAADAADAYFYFIRDVAGWSDIGETAYFLGRKEALSQ